MQLKNISINDYNYNLPEDKIAKYPLPDRESSNLLFYNQGQIQKDLFTNITQYLPNDHLMVFNNAKVVSARLLFQKDTGANIEIFCLEPYQPSDYAMAFQQTTTSSWKCMVGNLRKWKDQLLSKNLRIKNTEITLEAKKTNKIGNYVIVQFNWDNSHITFGEILDQAGKVPIPPYLNRDSESIDKERYQTKYSQVKGSVAAPTAGLHFDNQTLQQIKEKSIPREEITLHVGAGTFRPVQTDSVVKHKMHEEHFSVSLETMNQLIDHEKRILSVGTTTVRTLESIYWLGVKLELKPDLSEFKLDQWEHTELDIELPVSKALQNIRNYLLENELQSLNASTQIMITPGYSFQLTHALITNFHQPKSTLLLLIAAFIGDDWKYIYRFALENDFRFLSYGDSSLLFPKK
jgi:S-adenosylmethionine:tRNA ribosyltransferase-isomerase